MSFKDLDLKPAYRSRLNNVIQDFYIPVLKQSVVYKRAVGLVAEIQVIFDEKKRFSLSIHSSHNFDSAGCCFFAGC